MAPPSKAETSLSQPGPASSPGNVVLATGLFPRNGPDSTARSWGHHSSGVTFAAQHKLPKQPLPTLGLSCQRYLDALKPLYSPEGWEASQAAVRRFVQGEGPVLQAQLEAYNETHANYFEHFCYESFLGDDSPVVLNSNAFVSFTPDPEPSRNDQIIRATSLVRSALAFSRAIREDSLPLDEIRGRPQCMNQYWWLFGVTRVPGDDGGRIRMDADARHIMVVCRGQIYRMDVLDGQSGQIIHERALSGGLKAIMEDANSISQEEALQKAIGILTTENQKVWSHCRKALVHEGLQNGRNFAAIDSSLFALCLDDNSPQSEADVCMNMLCGTNVSDNGVQVGTCLNRWYDKLSIIVCRNGAAGMNFEHTCSDGSVDVSMACDIYRGSLSPSSDQNNKKWRPTPEDPTVHTNGSINGGAALPRWQKLTWDIPHETSKTLRLAETHLTDRINRHQLETLNMKNYGSTFIKAAGFSPDGFFQMVLQAAYYSQYKQIKSGFEPVVTRQFLHGRTDVARTTTAEAVSFARIFSDEKASKAEVLEAMHRAAEAHVTLSRSCAQGNSHHRHLYVLQQLWKRRRAFLEANAIPLPGKDEKGQEETTIFTDPGWSVLNTTVLMGSNVDNPYIAYAGFGPASAEGFTVVYYIRADHIAMSVVSRNGEAGAFRGAIERTLMKLKDMLEG